MDFLKRVLRGLRGAPQQAYVRVPEHADDYAKRLAQEREIFKDNTDVNALPAIFHYWSHHYVRPMLEEVGVSNPDQYFAHFLAESARVSAVAKPRFASLGAGNCDTEVRVAKLMIEAGFDDFVIECIDINETMLARGEALAAAEGVSRQIRCVCADFNAWSPEPGYAGIMANQSLHHMVELERVFALVAKVLAPRACFVVNDMIGRNGHQRWPEALDALQRFWAEMPEAYRYNRLLKRQEHVYENWDCSSEGFEGIRAQDILPLLIERFHFKNFIAFGNVVDVFIDRCFGHNFDGDGTWDRAFVDRLHAYDEQGLQDGTLTPTHLLAVMTVEPPETQFFSRGLRPERCVHPSLAS